MDTTKLRDHARRLASAGKHERAAEAFVELAAAERDNPRWPQKAGESYQRAGRSKAAIEAFSKAAGQYARQGFLLKAVAICRVILGIDEQHEATQEMLAELYSSRYGQVPAAALPKVAATKTDDHEIPIAVDASVEAEERAVGREFGGREFGGPVRDPNEIVLETPTLEEEVLGGGTMEVAAAEIIEEIGIDAEPEFLPEVEAIEVEPIELEPAHVPAAEAPPLVALRSSSTMELDEDALIPMGESLDCIEISSVLEALPAEVRAEIEGNHPPEQTREGVFELNLDEEFEAAFESIEAPTAAERIIDALPPTPLFSSLDRTALRMLIERVEVRMFGPGERIIRQGESGTSLFVLVEGDLAVWREGPPRVEVARLEEGAFCGEIALLTKRARSATVESLSECTVLEISREVIGELVLRQPSVLRVLLRFFRERLVDSLVDTHELFAPFAGPDRESLAQRFAFIEATKGTVLAREGEPIDGLYIILAGPVTASRKGGDSTPLSTGDVFGETSLLTSEDSVATITTEGKCWLLRMDQRAFRETIMTHPHVLAVLSDISAQRLAARSVALSGGQLDETQIPIL